MTAASEIPVLHDPVLPLAAPVTQTILASPELNSTGVFGNCLQAAVASLLATPLESVPHFAQFTWWHGALRLWLRGHGLDATVVGPSLIPASGPTLLLGRSARGYGHACVGDGPVVVWDPHPSRAGLVEVEEAVVIGPWLHGDRKCWVCNTDLGRAFDDDAAASS